MSANYKYRLFTFTLDAALNERISFEGGFVYIFEATDGSVNVDIQYDGNSADKIKLYRKRGILGNFKELYVTAAAQAGKSITILISTSYDLFRVMEQSVADTFVTNPSIPVTLPINPYSLAFINLVLTNANTEYSSGAFSGRQIMLKARGGDIKFCMISGQSGTTYCLLKDGQSVSFDPNDISYIAGSIYAQSPVAGAVLEIIHWG